MSGTVEVIVNKQEYECSKEGTLLDLAKKVQPDYPADIVLAEYDNKLTELHKKTNHNGHIKFLTTGDKNGRRAYRRSMVMLMQRAIQGIYPDEKRDIRVISSFGNGYYCEFMDGRKPEGDTLKKLGEEMRRLVDLDLPIRKYVMKTREAKKIFAEEGLNAKESLMKFRSSSNINIYEIDGFKDYFYGYMIPSTGYLKYFDLAEFEEGFVLIFPSKKDGVTMSAFEPEHKLFEAIKEAKTWSRTMGIPSVGALNEAIAEGKTKDIILMQEALMEERIGSLARRIAADQSCKFVMIAGPSSSGKTTFSHRLSIQLRAQGLVPHPFPLDDYYLNRDQMPLDEFGQKDFEALEGLDIELFNHDMTELLHGNRVQLPTFNFKTGKREYHDRYMQLGENDVLVIEGIHGLNDKLSYSLPKESKFKIYISALTPLAIDEHNPLSATDVRLIRRIVRDSRTRGSSAEETIGMWDSVRRGEENNIFPFQESADANFNSALIYELAVLKLYAQPQLFAIKEDSPQYVEAKRLLKLLDYVLPIPTEDINNNSLIREFIGGSCFRV